MIITKCCITLYMWTRIWRWYISDEARLVTRWCRGGHSSGHVAASQHTTWHNTNKGQNRTQTHSWQNFFISCTFTKVSKFHLNEQSLLQINNDFPCSAIGDSSEPTGEYDYSERSHSSLDQAQVRTNTTRTKVHRSQSFCDNVARRHPTSLLPPDPR